MKFYKNNYFASCSMGVEDVLAKEIKIFGGTNIVEGPGGISFQATEVIALLSALNSRVSSKIYKKLVSFEFSNERDINSIAKTIEWDKFQKLEQTIFIKSIISSDIKKKYPNFFKNSLYLSQVLKDSIVDYFQEKYSKRPSVDKNNADIKLNFRISLNPRGKDKFLASIFLDLVGESLYKRGYRIEQGLAPLQETLAASIIDLSEWNYDKEIFIDSMCGSGTFLIEAAIKKIGVSPSFLKIKDHFEKNEKLPWDFINHKFFIDNFSLTESFSKECSKLYDDILKKLNESKNKGIIIFGSDINSDVISQAKKNVLKAGFEDLISIRKHDATLLKPIKDRTGIIFCNMPYGHRIGDIKELESLYYKYGENLKNNFKDYRAYIFTGNFKLSQKISLKASRRIPLFNGPIECRLLKYDLY